MASSQTRVLVVDDEPTFRETLAELLEGKGYHVFQAGSRQEAIDLAADGTCDVAVLDLVLTDVSGIQLADEIRSRSPHTQIMILTGHGDKESAIEGIEHGVFSYLEKAALDIARLELSVRQAAERSRLQRENEQLVSRLQESNRLLTALHDWAANLTGQAHVDRLLDRLLVAAKELLRAETGRVLLFERTASEGFLIEESAGDGADTVRGMRLHPAEGIAVQVVKENAPVQLADPRSHPQFCDRCDQLPASLPGFLCAPLIHGNVLGSLIVAGRDPGFGQEDLAILVLLARQAAVGIDNARTHEQAINFFTHTSQILVSILDRMDALYPGHSRATAALADMVTRRLGMGDLERRQIHYAALLHDIGKLCLDPALLQGPVSEEQLRLIREHPALGVQLLRPITAWEEILPIIHAHHERWDGKGYPSGLQGEEIPVGARVVAVAECFDAMTRETPYGSRRAPEEALAELEACAGTQFDPRIVRLFVAEYRLRRDEIPS
jgi:putative nucleotidyltransferase with HDIG domain